VGVRLGLGIGWGVSNRWQLNRSSTWFFGRLVDRVGWSVGVRVGDHVGGNVAARVGDQVVGGRRDVHFMHATAEKWICNYWLRSRVRDFYTLI
jgi:hypothetical protein